MTISRRNVLLGATAAAALGPIAARAQTSEVAIGVIYPLSGSSAAIGVDAQHAFNTAADIINKNYDFALPLAKGLDRVVPHEASYTSGDEMVALVEVERMANDIVDRSFERVDSMVQASMGRMLPLALVALAGPFLLGLAIGMLLRRRAAS